MDWLHILDFVLDSKNELMFKILAHISYGLSMEMMKIAQELPVELFQT